MAIPARSPIPPPRLRGSRLAAALAAFFLATVPLGTAHAFGDHEAQNSLDPFPDTPGDPGGTVAVPLDVVLGLNVASGHFTCMGVGCMDNFDSFRMLVPNGLQITFSEFTVPRPQEPTNFDGGVPEQFFVFASDGVSFIEPAEENEDWKSPNLIGIAVFPNAPETFSVVLGPGYYDVVVANCCPPDTIVGGGSWEARFTATVPEPGTLLLLVSGVIAMGWRTRP